jgi:hypothetical protein
MADSLVSLAPHGVVFRARRIAGRGMAAAMIALAGTLAGCESPTEPPVELELDVAWQPSERIYTSSVEFIATVSGSSQASVAHSVNGGPFVPATPNADGTFRVIVDPAPMGTFTVTVKATHGRTETIATRQYKRITATLTLDAPAAGGTVYGRVVPFTGEVSPSLTIRTSLNGRPERAVQQFPPGPGGLNIFWAQVHPLANGLNTVRVNAYDGEVLAASTEFQVNAEVGGTLYDVVLVDDENLVLFGTHLGNDGRVAGHWAGAGSTQGAFTWKDGVVTRLEAMRDVRGLNNHGTVLGAPATGDLFAQRSVLWKDGVYTEIDGISGWDINDHGHILVASPNVGYWNGTAVVPYAEYDFNFPAFPRTMNNSGLIGGHTMASTRSNAAIWPGDGSVIRPTPEARNSSVEKIGDGGHALVRVELQPLLGPTPEFGGQRSYLYHLGASHDLNSLVGFLVQGGGVNASGTVAGTYIVDDIRRVFTWHDGRTTDVSTLGWAVERVTAIDDSGRILVHARSGVPGRPETQGKLVTLMLTPRP